MEQLEIFYNSFPEERFLYTKILTFLLSAPSIFIDKQKFARQFNLSSVKFDQFFDRLEALSVGERVYQYPTESLILNPIEHFKFYFYDFDLFNNQVFRMDQEGSLLEQKFFSYFRQKSDLFLFTYRTKESLEIDFIIQREDGSIDLIEIKKDQFIYAGDFGNMLSFDKEIIKQKNLFVLHNGERDKKEGKIFVIPLNKYINDFI